jgi:hypothetical protein
MEHDRYTPHARMYPAESRARGLDLCRGAAGGVQNAIVALRAREQRHVRGGARGRAGRLRARVQVALRCVW